jgi:hypothetical protein
LATLALASVLLWRSGPLYLLAAAGQAVSYSLATAGLVLRDHQLGRSKLFTLPAYFLLVQVASLHAMWNLLRGNRYERWQPTRAGEDMPEPDDRVGR